LTIHENVEEDQRRAEVFDALSHPTRIMILKALGEGALGFADLKKKTGIESSGHLQHHLTKLGPLVKTDDYGKYCLSDQGRDALLTVQTVENVAVSDGEKSRTRLRTKSFRNGNILKIVAVGIAVLLLASLSFNVYEFYQTGLLQNQVNQRDLAISQLQDISRIQIVKNTPDIGMTEGYPGLFFVGGNDTNMKPYRFWVDVLVQIRNPTSYNATLQLRGELNVTLSGQEAGNRVWNETRYFSVPMYSDDSYDFSLYRSNNYADQNAIKATVNSYAVYVVSAHIPAES
jgi:DNA-binding HxlR family transcriptional regulator